MSSTELKKAFRSALKNSLAIQSNEHLIIATENSLNEYGEVFWKLARRFTKVLTLIRFSNSASGSPELNEAMYASLSHCDAFILLAPNTLNEVRLTEICKKGTRFLAVQNATRGLIERTFDTNYQKISNLSRKVADVFSIGRTLHITSPQGTDVTISVAKTKGIAETGIVTKPGECSFLPAGEACLKLSKNINGQIAIDRIAGQKRKMSDPVFLKVAAGRITQIKGKKDAAELRKKIRKFGKNGRKLSEVGVGTNSFVTLGTSAREDEKAFGTIHVVLGENRITKVQGKIHQAIKAMILKPTLTIDGRVIIKNGNFELHSN